MFAPALFSRHSAGPAPPEGSEASMVVFNYSARELTTKIVYYGPGLCGKTTNLHWIYAKTSPQSRGEMVSLETETDRTLFFDLLPIDVGVIGGFKTRLQLYTIPGQVFYNTTRKLVLKGVDGLVFVADSQRAMLEANVESFKNLRENLNEIGLNLDDIPLVLQLNKRDLPNIVERETILDLLDSQSRYEHTEASAVSGVGVFETLKQISKLTLRTLRRRMTGEESSRLSIRRPEGDLPRVESLRPPFGAQEEPQAPRATIAGASTATPFVLPAPPPAQPTSPMAAASKAAGTGTAVQVAPQPEVGGIEMIEESAALEESPFEEAPFEEVFSGSAGARILEKAPLTSPASGPESEASTPEHFVPSSREPEVEFGQTEKPAKPASGVKHVKVRTSVDIMAELEALRKRATAQTPRVKKESATAPDPARPEMQKNISLDVPSEIIARAKTARVTVSFEDEAEGVIHSEERSVEIGDASDIRKLLVNLKIDVS
jgi:signal recognition particle receptor subunit beta